MGQVNTVIRQSTKIDSIIDEIEKVVLGKREVIEMILVALLAGGHVLIEDVPGVGKTTLANALAKATGLKSRRAQFTPDVMASDITGFTMYNKETNSFEYRQGLVMCNILLADEINRTSPKTQSALLEAMEEGNVTVDGVKHELPSPFMVIATQNQQGFVGTFPLPEAQLDRFLMKITIGYPDLMEEINLIADRRECNPINSIVSIFSKNEIALLKNDVKRMHIEANTYKFIVELVRMTREHKDIELGASPRASLALMRSAQAYAYINKRDYVIPEDVAKMFPYVVPHRLMLSQEAKIRRQSIENVIEEIREIVSVPYLGRTR